MREMEVREGLLRRIEWASGVILTIWVLGTWVLYSGRMAFGVFLGGAIAITSFQVLKWQLKRAFQAPGKVPQKAGLFASYYIRFLATLFLVFVVMYYGWANPVAFLAGLSVVVVGIFLVGGLEFLALLMKKGES